MTYTSEVLADSPEVYWRLGEPSGTTAADASGNGHTGTYFETPTLGVPGLLGLDADTAVTFEDLGGGQRVESDDTPIPIGTLASFTIECLFDVPATGAGQIVAIADPAEVAPDLIELGYLDGVVIFDFQGTSSYSPTASASAVGTHHFAAVYDGSDLILYVDGAAADSQPFSDAGALQTVANAVAAAHFPGGGAIGANGTLDEVAVYTTALSADRIAAHVGLATADDPMTEGPTVRLVTTRALAVPHQVQRWVLPIICKEMVQTGDQDNVEQPQDVAAVREFFLGLRRTGTPVAFQEGANRHLVVVRDVSFPDGFVEQWGSQRAGLEGILVVTLDSTES